MRKIKKLELPYDDGKGHFGSGASIIHIIRKVNEMIDLLNQEDWQRKSGTSKIPEGCYEIPLSEVDCIYQSPFSHTPTIKMKQPNELSCMKCGSKENLNSNKDGSFVECDNCMWGNDKSEKQEEWREKIKQMVLTDCFKDQPDIQRYIDFIEQLLSESKEKAKIEVLEKVLEKKTNYEIEREEHGYRVTLEYVLADDIKKEIKLLKEGDDLQE